MKFTPFLLLFPFDVFARTRCYDCGSEGVLVIMGLFLAFLFLISAWAFLKNAWENRPNFMMSAKQRRICELSGRHDYASLNELEKLTGICHYDLYRSKR